MFELKPFKSILDLLKAFPTEQVCIAHLETLRWNGNVISPFDPNSKVYKCAGIKYKCKNTGKYFNVLTGTIFENTKIPLQTWFLAIYLFTTHKKGISSYIMATELNITQKSSWFLLSRIRYAMEHENFLNNFDGTIEVDETYVGGKNKNRHDDKKKEYSQGGKQMQPVFGMFKEEVSEVIYRPNKKNNELAVREKVIHQHAVVRTEVVDNVQSKTLLPMIAEKVEFGSTIVSDEYHVYKNLKNAYYHEVVQHRLKNYVNWDGYTTNRLEGYWNILKKTWGTTYMGRVTVKHLHRYCRETEYRFNTRHLNTSDTFNLLLTGCEKRLRYVDLKNNK
ncbi:IS1595 family transposase [Flavipsychrobacter stenotrophus]|uniref:IS1595 family transposase n=1 Tax=Flavipsychrobacter stenotrophus TaxID=2077091 RepID=A0A2S7SU16_9BACT|nr:IS1595 family transposase [Flavipsychrobacter stenotrophus]PQJ10111.1 IS1595 family transposase [Flavipsychrobacter stenotrophus]